MATMNLVIRLSSMLISSLIFLQQALGSETPAPTPTPTVIPTSSLSPTDNPGSYNVDPTEMMSFYPIENQGTHNLDSTEIREYKISTGLLATALMVCVVVFIIVIAIILIRGKAKIKAALQQSAGPGETMNVEPVYEYITGPLPSDSDMNTQVNVAYGESDVNTQVNISINTQDNVAYGHTQAATAS